MGKILAIESTCDETAVAIVENGKKILSNITSLQIDIHAPFGGVVPELAARRHVELLRPTYEKALVKANLKTSDLSAIAVAHGPGLLGPLLVGMNFAKALSMAFGLPLIGVNHIEAHLYSAMMSKEFEEDQLPALGLVLSGGHTSLVHVSGIGSYKLLGQTRDDAIGEAFDKVAKLLDLGYPGGPKVELKAALGSKDAYPFKAPKVKEAPLDFSFSGLKTSVHHVVKDLKRPLSEKVVCDLCASFQRAAFDSIEEKLHRLLDANTPYKSVIFGGGVTMNDVLRERMSMLNIGPKCFFPPKKLALDNAAMLAGLAYHKLNDPRACLDLDASPLTRMPFSL